MFAIKYLRKLGYNITIEPFAENAKYFRNALVRANYQNYEKGVEETTEYLELFFRNVLLSEQNELKKRYEHIDWKAVSVQVMKSSEKSSEKGSENGSEKSSEKILRIMAEQPTITTAILAKEIGISTRAVDKQIAKLKALGQLQRIGADRGGHWEVIK